MKNMKKLITLVAICACALCIGLFGCSGGSADDGKNFVGTWELTGGTLDGEELTADTMEMMASMNLTVTLTLEEDGTASADLFGEVSEGTWKAKDANTASITLDGAEGDAKYDNGTLVMEEGSDRMEFTKK